MTDRDLTLRLPQIELADLPRPINGALERALRREQWPHLTQIIIDNALAARIAQRLDQLTNPNPSQLGIRAQQLADLLLERVELRRPLRTAKTRRGIRAQRHPDRVASQPSAAHQLLDRHPANEVLPAQLCPPLHVQHAPSPGLGNSDRTRLTRPRAPPPPPQRGQISTGEEGSVSHRHGQTGVSHSPLPNVCERSRPAKAPIPAGPRRSDHTRALLIACALVIWSPCNGPRL